MVGYIYGSLTSIARMHGLDMQRKQVNSSFAPKHCDYTQTHHDFGGGDIV